MLPPVSQTNFANVNTNFQLEDGLSEEFYLDDDDDDDEIKDPKSCWERVTDTLTSKPVLWGKQA
jgi:hypothetical protein